MSSAKLFERRLRLSNGFSDVNFRPTRAMASSGSISISMS